MAQSIEDWRSQSTVMSTSTKDVFRINPPRPFCYTDFVIPTPNPRVPRGMTEEDAKTKYLRTRLKRLTRVIEARLGKNRCFFAERQPRGKRKDTQFEITKLYALYEVDHWPGAFAQYEWTIFVMANMERDAMQAQGSHLMKLALPTLPASALPIYQEMMRQEGFRHAKIATEPGQINGLAFGGRYRGYNLDDPRRHELHDRPTSNHLPRQSLSGSQQYTSQAVYASDSVDPLGYTNDQLQEMIRNDQRFREMMPRHRAWISKQYRDLYDYFLRYLGRKPAMNLKTWDQLRKEAAAELKHRFTLYMHQVCHQLPGVRRDLSNAQQADSLMNVQYKIFYAYYRHKYTIPDGASSEIQAEFRRRHSVAATLKQRQLLQVWTTDAGRRASQHDGERYRKEISEIHDLWTGNVEDFATFDERNRQENTGLTAEMLPLAAQTPTMAPYVQGQSQASVESHTTPDPVQVQVQKQSVNRSELLARMQEKAQAETQTQGQPQTETLVSAQGSSEGLAHRREQMDADMTDSATADVPEPTQPQDHMEVDAMLRTRSQKQVQVEHMQLPAQELGATQATEQFPAEPQAAVQEHLEETAPPDTVVLETGSGPMEDVVPEQMPAQVLDAVVVPEPAGGSPEGTFQARAQSRSSPPAADLYAALIRETIQSGLKQSLDSETPEPSPSDRLDSLPAPPDSRRDGYGPALPHGQAPAEAIEPAKSRVLKPELQQAVRAQGSDPDQMLLEAHGLASAAGKEQQKLQAGLEEASEPPPTPLDESNRHSIAPEDGGATNELIEASADSPATHQEETQACTSPSTSSNHQADEQVQQSGPINKCHYCTNSQTRCNGERPCQFCIKYGRKCYDLNKKPTKTRGANLKARNASENKQTKKAVDEELSDAQSAATDDASTQVPEDESPLQSILQDGSQEKANNPEQDPDEVTAKASDSGRSEVETVPSPPFHTTKHEPSIEIIIPKTNVAPPEARATKAQQKSKQTTSKSNVITRRAEQMIAEQSRRSLRSRDVLK